MLNLIAWGLMVFNLLVFLWYVWLILGKEAMAEIEWLTKDDWLLDPVVCCMVGFKLVEYSYVVLPQRYHPKFRRRWVSETTADIRARLGLSSWIYDHWFQEGAHHGNPNYRRTGVES